MESVSRGEFDELDEIDLAEELARRWDANIDCNLSVEKEKGLLGPPAPVHRWPFYELKRGDALALALRLVRARSEGDGRGASDVEVDLSSDDPPLHGRIDRVERTAGAVRIIDLKTSTPDPEGEIPANYLVQLEVYAALFLAAAHETPTEIGIQYFDGTRVTRSIDWDEVDSLISTVLALRKEVNEALERGANADYAHLARIDAVSCIHCDAQPVCEPFHRDTAQHLPPYAASVVGRVLGRAEANDGWQLSVADMWGKGTANETRIVTVLGIPETLIPEVGETVSVCWAVRNPRTQDLRVNWQSVLYRWPPELDGPRSLPPSVDDASPEG